MLYPSYFVAKAGTAQKGDFHHPTGGDISWAAPYTRRFPNPAISRVLEQEKSLTDGFLGGLPPP
jgi:poly(beta-D-mannuronate) lyase